MTSIFVITDETLRSQVEPIKKGEQGINSCLDMAKRYARKQYEDWRYRSGWELADDYKGMTYAAVDKIPIDMRQECVVEENLWCFEFEGVDEGRIDEDWLSDNFETAITEYQFHIIEADDY